MPVFIDTHEGSVDLPQELRDTVTKRVRTGEKDQFGVVDRGIIIDREGRKMHCVLEAPDVDAVKKHHAAFNVPIAHETIHRADIIFR